MDKSARRRLEAAGFTVGTSQDLFDLTDEEMELVRARVDMIEAIRLRRTESRLTQKELAKRAKITQARVSKIESGGEGVSMDVLFRTYFAAGGKWEDFGAVGRAPARSARRVARPKSATSKK